MAEGASLVCRVLKHDVAGERRLDGDLGGLEVADLADEDHVRVLAQDAAEARGEGDADLLVDLAPARCPSRSYSTGSSVVMILTSIVLASLSAE